MIKYHRMKTLFFIHKNLLKNNKTANYKVQIMQVKKIQTCVFSNIKYNFIVVLLIFHKDIFHELLSYLQRLS